MSYATLDNILLDQDTLDAFEALARSRCVSPQVLARQVITDTVEPRSSKPDLDEFVPRRRAKRAAPDKLAERRRRLLGDLDDDRDPLPMRPDPDDEPASERIARRVRSHPL